MTIAERAKEGMAPYKLKVSRDWVFIGDQTTGGKDYQSIILIEDRAYVVDGDLGSAIAKVTTDLGREPGLELRGVWGPIRITGTKTQFDLKLLDLTDYQVENRKMNRVSDHATFNLDKTVGSVKVHLTKKYIEGKLHTTSSLSKNLKFKKIILSVYQN